MLRRTDNSNLIQSGNNNLTPTNKFTNNQIREYQELADKAIDLILFNKINSKNAFDVNNSFLEQLPMFLNQKEESSWQRISATLDASAKIYGYRVDSVHSEMFKFLGGLNRTEFHEDVEHNKKKKLDEPENNNEKTIEKDISKLDLLVYDLEFSVDPLFKNMTAKFNETGASKLLYKILPLNENLDILFESTEAQNENDCFVDNSEHNEETKRIVGEQIDQEDIRKMSICYDLSLIKRKYHLEEQRKERTLLDELLEEEGEDYIMEEAPKELYEDEEKVAEKNEEIKDENIMNENEHLDNSHLIQNNDKDENNQADLVVEMKKDDINVDNLEIKDSKNDWKSYLLNFGAGNANVFKDFSQGGAFKSNFHKKEKNKKALKNEENEEKPVIKNKENTLFEFKAENVPDQKELYKKRSKESPVNELQTFIGKKRKILKLNHLESSLSLHYFITDIVQLRNEKKRNLKASLISYNNNNDDKFVEDVEYEEGFAYEGENDNLFSKGNKVKNRLFNGKFGKLYRSFNLQVLKHKMWDLLTHLWNKNKLDNNNHDTHGEVYFSNFLTSLNKEYEFELKEKISKQTCFVCLLHLANEKNLILEEVSENNFKIKKRI